MVRRRPASRRARLLSGAGAAVYDRLVTVVIQVASVPVFLHYWGVNEYGAWLALSAGPAYLTMSDLGFGTVAGSEMIMHVGKDDRDSALNAFQSAWMLTSALSMVAVIALSGVAIAVPFERVLHLSYVQHDTAAAAVVLLGLYTAVGQQGGFVDAGFRCEGNYGLGILLFATVRLVEFIAVLVVVALGGGLIGAAVAYVVGRSVGTLAMRVILWRLSPWIRFGIRDASMTTLRRLTQPALAFLCFPLGNAASIQGVALVVSGVLGPVTLVVFSTLRTLTRSCRQFVTIVNLVVWPEISRSFGAKAADEVRLIHRRACQVSTWTATVMIVALLALGAPILHLWTQGKVHMVLGVFVLLLGHIFLNSLWSTSSVVLSATNNHIRVAIQYALVTGLGIIISVVLGEAIGMSGVALALLMIDAAMIMLVFRTSLPFVKDELRPFAWNLLKPPLFLLRQEPTKVVTLT